MSCDLGYKGRRPIHCISNQACTDNLGAHNELTVTALSLPVDLPASMGYSHRVHLNSPAKQVQTARLLTARRPTGARFVILLAIHADGAGESANIWRNRCTLRTRGWHGAFVVHADSSTHETGACKYARSSRHVWCVTQQLLACSTCLTALQ
jgi:hypothetical protein